MAMEDRRDPEEEREPTAAGAAVDDEDKLAANEMAAVGGAVWSVSDALCCVGLCVATAAIDSSLSNPRNCVSSFETDETADCESAVNETADESGPGDIG